VTQTHCAQLGICQVDKYILGYLLHVVRRVQIRGFAPDVSAVPCMISRRLLAPTSCDEYSVRLDTTICSHMYLWSWCRRLWGGLPRTVALPIMVIHLATGDVPERTGTHRKTSCTRLTFQSRRRPDHTRLVSPGVNWCDRQADGQTIV